MLTRIDWYDNVRRDPGGWTAISRVEIPAVLGDLLERLRGYFEAGEPIGAVPWEAIETRSLSDFQLKVYKALTEIPHGETRTYAWVANRVGQAAAPRAVGQALRKNPMPILIPCHRVVSANALGGFMGIVDPEQPELRLKHWLIELERSYRNPVFSFLSPLPEYARMGATG